VIFFCRRAHLTVLLFAITGSLAVQKDSARIFGSVVDPSGSVVAGVELHVKPDCKCSDCSDPKECRCCPPQVTVTTDETGHYEVRLPSGEYTFAVRDTKMRVSVGSEDKNVNITIQ